MKRLLPLILAAALAACASAPPAPPPELVEVPVFIPPPELPIPEPPAWRSPSADPSDSAAYVKALALDLVDAWRYALELRQVLEAHNEAARSD
jgi:hypothetical protein